MRVLSAASLIGMMLITSNADAGCRRREERSPAAWATRLVRSADVIMYAEVVQQQDITQSKAAVLRPMIIYKGSPADSYTMSLPRSDNVIVTESYAGFDGHLRERRFVLLHKTSAGFEIDPCQQYLVEDSAIRSAVIRKTRH